MKRFYTLVSISEGQEGFSILLDGKPVKTPAGKAVVCSVRKLADAMLAEWVAQTGEIKPETMPVTQYLVTTLDRPAGARDAIERHVLSYIDTDLICYRANEPRIYAASQSESWDPVLEWIRRRFGFSILTTTDLGALTQGEDVHAAFAAYVARMDDLSLTVFADSVESTGSFFLTLALREKVFLPENVFSAAQVEEIVRAKIYREDVHGSAPDVLKKQESLRRMLAAAALCFEAL